MRFKNKIIKVICAIIIGFPLTGNAQKVVRDNEKQKQWQSMENDPWNFSPDWYYYFLHNKYSGAEMYWKWAGLKSAEETQRQKVDKVEKERQHIEELYKEELLREADRAVDLMYDAYKDEFNRMQDRIRDGLLYCMNKSDGKLKYQVDELSRQNEILCADIAYIHKTGVGYGLENAKRQQAYEEAKAKMGELVNRTAHLCAVAATHY